MKGFVMTEAYIVKSHGARLSKKESDDFAEVLTRQVQLMNLATFRKATVQVTAVDDGFMVAIIDI